MFLGINCTFKVKTLKTESLLEKIHIMRSPPNDEFRFVMNVCTNEFIVPDAIRCHGDTDNALATRCFVT